jgi:hypothetical protein
LARSVPSTVRIEAAIFVPPMSSERTASIEADST